MQSQAFGLVTDLRPDNFLQTLSETRPALALFHEPGAAGVDVASAHLAHVAATFADGLDFVKVPRAHYEGLAVRLGVDKTPLSLAILDFGTRLHYAYGGTTNGDATNTTADSIAAFVQDYLSGDLSPLPPPPDAVKPAATKAESDGDDEEDTLELPTSLEDVPETVVVANPTADSLMDFWVPWCDFYIHISVPADGAPRVSIPLELPAFAEPAPAAADAGAAAAATKGAVDPAASVEEVEAS